MRLPTKSDLQGTEANVEKWEYRHTFGKGEWVAETLEDAKQMAMDFRRGTS